MIRSAASNDGRANSPVMSIERRLELLETRFTQPSNGSALEAQPGSFRARSPPPGTGNDKSNSEHSFSFPSIEHKSSSNLPPSAVRSRRRPSMATTFHAVEMATARHMRRLAATSPILGLSSNTSSPSNSASQQTLLTSHVNTQSSTHSRSNTSRVVAETPPVIVSPHNRMTAEAPPAKPAAARNILNKSTSNPVRGVLCTSVDESIGLDSKLNSVTHIRFASTPLSLQKRKSIPKRKNPSIKDKSVMHSPEPNKKSRSEPTELRSPKATSGLSELSRGSNPASLALSKKKITPPVNNMRIHDFFSAATKKKKDNTNVNTETPTTATTNSMTATTTNAASENSLNTASNAIPTDWQAKCQKLQQVLQDKEEQLKAVTNNKTILHTALQSALTKTKAELQDLEASSKQRNAQTSNVLEELLRWKSAQQAKELRERLAADGARLGRIVYARAGMRALENWEEGYATKDLEYRKAELKKKRKALEQRLQSSSDKENQTRLDAMETQESIQMHLENFRTKERELNDEEKALNDEKGAHIRALKRVASEDASRFRSRPKVRIDKFQNSYGCNTLSKITSNFLPLPLSYVVA